MDYEFVPGRDDFPPDEIAMLRQQLADVEESNKTVEKERLKYANQILRGIAVALANAYAQGDPIQFYECGLQEDGTYKWKGCRFGVEGREYYSGFSA